MDRFVFVLDNNDFVVAYEIVYLKAAFVNVLQVV